eukprot:scaffold43646_cov19-Tisochrysis_lutea.AAC.1
MGPRLGTGRNGHAPEAQPEIRHVGLVDVVAVGPGAPVLGGHPVLLAGVGIATVEHAVARDLTQVCTAHLPDLCCHSSDCRAATRLLCKLDEEPGNVIAVQAGMKKVMLIQSTTFKAEASCQKEAEKESTCVLAGLSIEPLLF